MEKKSINEILADYTAGKTTVEETNAALAGSGFHLDPGKNVLTEEEMRASVVGYYPNQANGFGLLDSGTGTLDKVEVRGGKLAHCNMGDSMAIVIMCGKQFYVKGDTLTEEKPEDNSPVVPERPDMRRRTDLAGTVQRQKTKQGVYDVHYNEDGYAVKASRVTFD